MDLGSYTAIVLLNPVMFAANDCLGLELGFVRMIQDQGELGLCLHFFGNFLPDTWHADEERRFHRYQPSVRVMVRVEVRVRLRG